MKNIGKLAQEVAEKKRAGLILCRVGTSEKKLFSRSCWHAENTLDMYTFAVAAIRVAAEAYGLTPYDVYKGLEWAFIREGGTEAVFEKN